MRIKLMTANFGGMQELLINNQTEIDEYKVDVVKYNDVNTSKRNLSLHPRLKGKIPKMLEWEKGGDYDYYIWVDSKFIMFDGFIKKMLEGIQGYDLCLFNHPQRQTISSELDFMNTLMKNGDQYLISRYVGEDMEKQVNVYLSDKNFIDDKLFSCGCFIYSKNLIVDTNNNVLKEWFYHNTTYSIQDQLSLPYLLQKFKVNYNTFDFNILVSDYLRHR